MGEEQEDPVRHWAMIKRQIIDEQEAVKVRILKEHGMSKSAFDELGDQVAELASGDGIMTEYGRVQGIAGPVTWKAHRMKEGFLRPRHKKPYLLRMEE